MEGVAGVTGAIGPQSGARAVMLEAVRLDHESHFLVSEVRDREESWFGDDELRGQRQTGRECECPEYGLERVLLAAVGVGRHPPDGDGPGSASIRRCSSQAGRRHHSRPQGRVGDRQPLVEWQDPRAVEDGTQGTGHPRIAFSGAEIGPPDLDTLHRHPYVTFPWDGHPCLLYTSDAADE